MVDRLSQERIDIDTSFLYCRCIILRSRTSSKVDDLGVLFKVTELFIHFVMWMGYLKKD